MARLVTGGKVRSPVAWSELTVPLAGLALRFLTGILKWGFGPFSLIGTSDYSSQVGATISRELTLIRFSSGNRIRNPLTSIRCPLYASGLG